MTNSVGGSIHRVVVVGGGFGGLHAVRKLRRAPVEITLVDRRNFHLFQPLVNQLATGGGFRRGAGAPAHAHVADTIAHRLDGTEPEPFRSASSPADAAPG